MSLIDNAVEAIAALGQFSPETASELSAYLHDIQEVPQALAEALAANAEHFGSDKPVDSRIADMLRDASATARGANEALADAHDTFRQLHERELERIENPRPGEQMWDVSKQ
jgi:hypothetical protein